MTIFKGEEDDQAQTVIDGEDQDQNQDQNKVNDSETVTPAPEPSWFDEATKFYVGKNTTITPDDELGKEMWSSIKQANKLKEEVEGYKKQVEEVSPYKSDLEWIMNQPQLRESVLALLNGKPLPVAGQLEDELTPEEQKIKGLEDRLSQFEQVSNSQVDHTIRAGFEAHLTELLKTYPDMDVETVKSLAIATKAIYSPKGKEMVEQMAKQSHDKIEALKKKFTDKTYQDLREKGKKTPPSSTSGASRRDTNSFRGAFDKAWEDF